MQNTFGIPYQNDKDDSNLSFDFLNFMEWQWNILCLYDTIVETENRLSTEEGFQHGRFKQKGYFPKEW